MLGLARNLAILSVLVIAAMYFFKPSDLVKKFGGDQQARVVEANPQSSRNRQQSTLINQIVLERAPDGHYYVTAEVEGTPVDFVVDTGASMIALSKQDAERIGYRDSDLDYTMRAQTANGIALFAPVILEDVAIDQLEIDNVGAAVSQTNIGKSLLGMTFLNRLDSFQVEDGNLILNW